MRTPSLRIPMEWRQGRTFHICGKNWAGKTGRHWKPNPHNPRQDSNRIRGKTRKDQRGEERPRKTSEARKDQPACPTDQSETHWLLKFTNLSEKNVRVWNTPMKPAQNGACEPETHGLTLLSQNISVLDILNDFLPRARDPYGIMPHPRERHKHHRDSNLL